jgi:hypothetical protein
MSPSVKLSSDLPDKVHRGTSKALQRTHSA